MIGQEKNKYNNKNLSTIYTIWVIVTGSISLFIVINFWPDYLGDMFPLFTDFTTFLLFLPAYFVLFFSIVSQLINIFIVKSGICKKFNLGIFIFAFIFSLGFLEYKFMTKFIFSSLCSAVGILHFLFSEVLRKREQKL